MDEAAQGRSPSGPKTGPARPTWLYSRGLIDELAGYGEKAAESYEKARAGRPRQFAAAIFRLAYYYDLHGEEEKAIELYKECLAHPPVYANALMNLAVLYEDAGQYDQAIRCLQRRPGGQPQPSRGRGCSSRTPRPSRTMFFDEDQAKRVARRNAVLDIPVTDFELSVRARNCLKKMNIRTLGDLVRTTEPELLALQELRRDLAEGNQGHADGQGPAAGPGAGRSGERPPRRPPPQIPLVQSGNEGVLATPVEQLEFSIRARKALEGLKITHAGRPGRQERGRTAGLQELRPDQPQRNPPAPRRVRPAPAGCRLRPHIQIKMPNAPGHVRGWSLRRADRKLRPLAPLFLLGVLGILAAGVLSSCQPDVVTHPGARRRAPRPNAP